MRFFKLSTPNYDTDEDEARRNPLTSLATHRIPGVMCPDCGPWSSSHRLRVPLPGNPRAFEGISFLPYDQWARERDRWATELRVNAGAIEPGAELGPPRATCTATSIEPIVHPMPGEVWVASFVRDLLEDSGLTGATFAPVILPDQCSTHELHEIVVHGRAWRVGSSEATLRACGLCGRRVFPSPHHLVVDESRWDGSDFILVDGNPNIIIVSARVADVVTDHQLENIEARPIG